MWCMSSSRKPPAGAHYLATDFSSALRLVDTELAEQADQVWVIGGSSLYKVGLVHPGYYMVVEFNSCLTIVPS